MKKVFEAYYVNYSLCDQPAALQIKRILKYQVLEIFDQLYSEIYKEYGVKYRKVASTNMRY